MGTVWRARAPEGHVVAVKLVARLERAGLERFAREVRILRTLGDGDGFVPLLDAGEQQGFPYLVMPLLEGGTLRDRLARGPMAVADVIELGVSLGEALGRAHGIGVVHRDVKPEN